jgi:hypothetical protein
MMTQPKLCNHPNPLYTKNDGTGFDFESVLGRTDGSVLAVGVDDDGGT